MRRFLLWLACIVLLIVAQQNALTHAVWHATGSSPAHHESQGKSSFHGGLCDLHHAFSQVTGGVQAVIPLCPTKRADASRATSTSDSVAVSEFFAPLSRGPPLFS